MHVVALIAYWWHTCTHNEVRSIAEKVFTSYTEMAFTDKEIEKLLSNCNTLEEEVIIMLGITLGLRRQDMVKLRIRDIDTETKTLTFYEHKKRRSRTIPIPQHLATLLKQYINTRGKKEEYLFKYGKSKYGGFTLWRRLNDLCDRAGLPRRPFHSLRGTCYKRCIDQDWSPVQAAWLLGDTVRTAQLHYAKPSPAEMAELIERTGSKSKIKTKNEWVD